MKIITESLLPFGISPRYKGYRQLIYMLTVALSDDTHGCPPAQELYKKAAAFFGCSWRSIEQNIRTLVKLAWEINPTYLRQIAGYELHSAPSAAQLITMLYCLLHNQSF